MLNWIFFILIVGSVLTAAFTGTMNKVTEASVESAKGAVTFALLLAGQMALWLGLMSVLREAGLMRSLTRLLRPLMTRLFPEVPPDHPAMGAMILNLAANMLGVGNAATPFGLKAMAELDKLNPRKGVATNSMALFLAINTSGVAVLALDAISARASLHSKDPAGVLLPSLIATFISTVVAIIVIKLTQRLAAFAPERYATAALAEAAPEKEIAGLAEAELAAVPRPPAGGPRLFGVALIAAALAAAVGLHLFRAPSALTAFERVRPLFSDWALPVLMAAILVFGMGRKVKVYEIFVANAKEGFQTAVRIIPYLVAILVAIGMFRASGALEAIVSALGPLTSRLGFPAEALPMALIRPLSGSGALAVMKDTMEAHGPDSFVGYLVSVINGSMETTFYVLALYFGSVQVRATRHTLIACLSADLAGVIAATAICHLFFG